MRHSAYIIVTLFISLLISTFTGCGGHNSGAWKSMDIAESIIEEHPDSSYQILQSIETSSLKDDEERARYALLMSMALDKNYIDTTTFDVLQPAIDYYLKKGSPDEKLRTLYYEGVIFKNDNDDNKAMDVFLEAMDIMPMSTDTLCIARLLTNQGTLYYKQYKFREFVNNSLKTANLLKEMNPDYSVLFDYAKALNGALLLKDRNLADSVYSICLPMLEKDSIGAEYVKPQILLYKIMYGSEKDKKEILSQYTDDTYTNGTYLNLAHGYYMIGEGKKALENFERVDSLDPNVRYITYLLIKSDILGLNGRYEEAFHTYQELADKLESHYIELLKQDMLFAEKKHTLETDKLSEKRKKDRAIWISIMVLVLSTIIIGWQKHRHQLLSVRARFAEQERKLSEQEREKVNLENENLLLRISQLESEREELKALRNSNDLPQQVSDAVKERIEMLNALLAEKITDNDTYSKSYSKWIDTVTSDREKFMNSTRLAFKASHPKFIEFLESHDLTEAEINYLCLYAIGLRGKEVGEYIQLKRHYHISSEIRSKLGIDEHETNIGIYVRKLLKQL